MRRANRPQLSHPRRRALLPLLLIGVFFFVPSEVTAQTKTGAVTEFATRTADAAPQAITLGPGGNVWFTEYSAARVGKISTNGSLTEFSSGISPQSQPAGITTGPDRNIWFTENTAQIARIRTDGVVTEFAAGCETREITTGPNGNLWYSCPEQDMIGESARDGRVVATYSVSNGGRPNGIVTGSDGNVWFTNGRSISKFDPRTRRQTNYSISSPAQNLTVGPDRNVWFTEHGADKVGKVTPSGVVTEFSRGITPRSQPYGITAGPDGNVWFTELAASKIARITPSGAVTEFTLGPNRGPWDITVGADGNLWFTEAYASKIGRLTVAKPSPASSGSVSRTAPASGQARAGSEVTLSLPRETASSAEATARSTASPKATSSSYPTPVVPSAQAAPFGASTEPHDDGLPMGAIALLAAGLAAAGVSAALYSRYRRLWPPG